MKPCIQRYLNLNWLQDFLYFFEDKKWEDALKSVTFFSSSKFLTFPKCFFWKYTLLFSTDANKRYPLESSYAEWFQSVLKLLFRNQHQI